MEECRQNWVIWCLAHCQESIHAVLLALLIRYKEHAPPLRVREIVQEIRPQPHFDLYHHLHIPNTTGLIPEGMSPKPKLEEEMQYTSVLVCWWQCGANTLLLAKILPPQ